jgi:glycosyltransferase involved in cell wall biosynthesis
LNFKQKQIFLAEAKAVLMPIQWDDPLPTVALESLAAGTPVIAWNRSSMGEIIEMVNLVSSYPLSKKWQRE